MWFVLPYNLCFRHSLLWNITSVQLGVMLNITHICSAALKPLHVDRRPAMVEIRGSIRNLFIWTCQDIWFFLTMFNLWEAWGLLMGNEAFWTKGHLDNSVQHQTTSWTTEKLRFKSWQGQITVVIITPLIHDCLLNIKANNTYANVIPLIPSAICNSCAVQGRTIKSQDTPIKAAFNYSYNNDFCHFPCSFHCLKLCWNPLLEPCSRNSK
jgi:hypothetical protein